LYATEDIGRLEGGGGRAPQGIPPASKIQKPFSSNNPLLYIKPSPNTSKSISKVYR